MRRVVAFFLASLVYLMAGAAVWWIGKSEDRISLEYESTAVALVSPEESFEKARQEVNTEASERKSEEEKTEAKPETIEEPVLETSTKDREADPPPEPPREEEMEVPSENTVTKEELKPEQDLQQPPDLSASPPEPTVPLEPVDPIDAKRFLSLKQCPQVRSEKKSRRHYRHKTQHRTRHVKRTQSSRVSEKSRARRGGGKNVNRLLARIKRRIARNKSYPRSAKRRRMEGSVRVSFTITRGGGVRGIRCQGLAPFCASARSAVRRAFPVRTGDASSSLPRRVTVTLRYRLH